MRDAEIVQCGYRSGYRIMTTVYVNQLINQSVDEFVSSAIIHSPSNDLEAPGLRSRISQVSLRTDETWPRRRQK